MLCKCVCVLDKLNIMHKYLRNIRTHARAGNVSNLFVAFIFELALYAAVKFAGSCYGG